MLELDKIRAYIRRKQDIKDAYRAVFETEAGRQVLEHLSRNCYVYTPTYVPNDPNETAHREGMRRVVLSIVREINSPDEVLHKMIEESFNVPAPTQGPEY
jgi:alpha-L-arabinofuranosidase